MTAVCVRELGKRYGDVIAVRDVSLDVARGEIFGLLGRNGAGKTTTLECIIGLRRPDGGAITVGAIDMLREPRRARARVGAVLQTTALQDRVTPREALRLFARLHGRPVGGAEQLLRDCDLVDKANAPFASLSGGQRQRLALALAFVHGPDTIVLDEPTAGLDPGARRDLHDRIVAMRDRGCAVLLSTHDMAEAQRLCDRLAILHRGAVVATGTPEQLIDRSGAPTVVRLRTAPALAREHLLALPEVGSCSEHSGTWKLEVRATTPVVSALAGLAARERCEILELGLAPPTLEDAFLRLTGSQDQAVPEEGP